MANPIQFWLSFNNKAEMIQLPVNPATIQISGSHGYQEIDVNGLGEYTVIGDPKLRDYSFNSFFPRDYNPAYCEYADIMDPWDYVQTIERWVKTRRPIRLTVTGWKKGSDMLNVAVTIRNFSYEPERDGSVGDIYFELSLKEYVFIDFSRVTRSEKVGSGASASNKPKRPDDTEQPKTRTVVRGDSLWKIAQRVYGSGSKWKTIYDANKAKIGKDPNVLKIGTELRIP